MQTTILSTQGEIQLHFLCAKSTVAEAEQRIARVMTRCEKTVGEFVFSHGDALEQVVLRQLAAAHLTLATAESCTGGQIAQRLTSVPGSSESFVGGAVVYSNSLKTLFAGVPASLIEQHGAVSREVASALADGIRARTGADFGIGVTGIAGPGGATETKPAGRVYIALAEGTGTTVSEFNLMGDRERVRWFASQHALVMLRHHLAARLVNSSAP